MSGDEPGDRDAAGTSRTERRAAARRRRRAALLAAVVVVLAGAGLGSWLGLRSSPTPYPVTVYPGDTLKAVSRALDVVPGDLARRFAAAAASGEVSSPFEPAGTHDLEGLLGPGTYQVTAGEPARQVLAQMVQRFDHQAAEAGLTTASATALGMTPYEVVTAASIVEKEGYIEKNMPQVARVIYNRLADQMPLQMDSTVLYSLGQDGGPVTEQDLKLDTPYNTYLHTGLTPTPICFPSEAALRAAVSPPTGPWLYFVVVQKDGTEAFATTYQQQLANEQLAQSRGLG